MRKPALCRYCTGRALSLALASIMLLCMMVVGTSAASYPDVDENDNVYINVSLPANKNLDSNFTGDLSVVFEKGSAVVVIFNDTTEADEEEEPEVGGVEIKSFDPYTGKVEVYGADDVPPVQVISYLKSKGYTNVTVTAGATPKYNFTMPDGTKAEELEVDPTQVFKVSLGTTKTATAKGVTFTITNFTEQYVNATDGYTVEVVVTGALEGTTAATGTVTATTTGTAATLGTAATKTGVTPSANFGTYAAGKVVIGTTDNGATTGIFLLSCPPRKARLPYGHDPWRSCQAYHPGPGFARYFRPK